MGEARRQQNRIPSSEDGSLGIDEELTSLRGEVKLPCERREILLNRLEYEKWRKMVTAMKFASIES